MDIENRQGQFSKTYFLNPKDEIVVPHLTSVDLDRLIAYKWRYSLESHGFSPIQASYLLFTRWLYEQGFLEGDNTGAASDRLPRRILRS